MFITLVLDCIDCSGCGGLFPAFETLLSGISRDRDALLEARNKYLNSTREETAEKVE